MYWRAFIFCFLIVFIIFLSSSFYFDKNISIKNEINIQSVIHNCNGQDTINVTFQNTVTSVKLFWAKNSNPWDSVMLTNTGGYNWRGIFYTSGNGTYKYYIKFIDSLNRIATIPAGAPANYYSFVCPQIDTIKPVITHTPIGNTPKFLWPITVSAAVSDASGIDSVWVRWRKNSGITKHFKLFNYSGNNYSNIFNSIMSDVNPWDTIRYRIIAQDASSQHNKDSTTLINFLITSWVCNFIGNDTIQINYPFSTNWWGSRTQMLWTVSELQTCGSAWGMVLKMGFYATSASSQIMNGLTIKMQNSNLSSLSSFVNSNWTTVYSSNYSIPGAGWHYISIPSLFVWNGTSNLLVEFCFENTSSTTSTILQGTTATGKVLTESHNVSSACTSFNSPSIQNIRPNVCFEIMTPDEIKIINQKIPNTYNLSQNYPNPFNPITRINFDIPKQGIVKLKIFDILGREVKELVNEMKSMGSYSVDFNAAGLTSGIYLYRLECNGYIETRRMVLLK